MSDFIKKIKEDAKAVSAAVDQELTVLEGVPGYDPLADRQDGDETGGDAKAGDAKAGDATGADPASGAGSEADPDASGAGR